MTQEEQAAYGMQMNQPPDPRNELDASVDITGEAQLPVPAPPPFQPRKSEVEETRPILLTYQQVMDNYDILSRKMAYLVNHAGQIVHCSTGFTANKDEALKSTISVLMSYGTGCRYALVDQDMAREILKKKCNITRLLGDPMVAMLKQSPKNPTLRARILAATGQMPPVTIETYGDLRSWVESSCGSRTMSKTRENMICPVVFRTVESGTVSYEVPLSVIMNYTLTIEIMERLVSESISYEDLYGKIKEHLKEHAEDELNPDSGNMEYGEHNYENHAASSTGDMSTSISRSGSFQVGLREYLERNFAPEELRRLGIG